jgi:hypothetical protein
MGVDDVLRAEGVEPLLDGLAGHAHGGGVDHHSETRMIHHFVKLDHLRESVFSLK